jgi:glutamate racemase
MLGVFDSGIGGLTVVKAIKKSNPELRIVYYGDTARYPWGNKSVNTIRAYTSEITKFFLARKIKKIVIACNTASTYASAYLKKKYPEVEFLDVILPVVDRIKTEIKSLKTDQKLKVGIIGTRATIGSQVYEKKLLKLNLNLMTCYSKACPLFVPLAEEGWLDQKATKLVIKEYLSDLKEKNLDYLILGCTHYPLLKKRIAQFFGPKTKIISSAEEIAQAFKESKDQNKSRSIQTTKDIYYFSDLNKHYKNFARNILGGKVKIKRP